MKYEYYITRVWPHITLFAQTITFISDAATMECYYLPLTIRRTLVWSGRQFRVSTNRWGTNPRWQYQCRGMLLHVVKMYIIFIMNKECDIDTAEFDPSLALSFRLCRTWILCWILSVIIFSLSSSVVICTTVNASVEVDTWKKVENIQRKFQYAFTLHFYLFKPNAVNHMV